MHPPYAKAPACVTWLLEFQQPAPNTWVSVTCLQKKSNTIKALQTSKAGFPPALLKGKRKRGPYERSHVSRAVDPDLVLVHRHGRVGPESKSAVSLQLRPSRDEVVTSVLPAATSKTNAPNQSSTGKWASAGWWGCRMKRPCRICLSVMRNDACNFHV